MLIVSQRKKAQAHSHKEAGGQPGQAGIKHERA